MKKNFLLSIALLVSAFVSAQPAPGSFKQTWKVGPDWLRNELSTKCTRPPTKTPTGTESVTSRV